MTGFGITGSTGMLFGGMGAGIAGVTGTGGWTGVGMIGAGVGETGCIGPGNGSMGGRPGLRVCAGAFNTTIRLIRVTDKSVRRFLFFIFISVVCLCLVAVNVCRHPAFEIKLRAVPDIGYGV